MENHVHLLCGTLGVLSGGEKSRMSVVMAELLISHQSVSYLHGRPKEMDVKVN